jgi:tripartite-type tricarboxylate transporter receptor subunit TctC
MNTMPGLRTLTALLLGAVAATAGAQAQKYPVRTVRVVIPFAAGGATDVPGRFLAQKLAEALGQQVIVDNRPGAGSTVGAEIVAKAAPDGYTLLLTGAAHVMSAGLYSKLPYDPIRDFTPLVKIGSGPNVAVVHPSLPARNVAQLVVLAKARPGELDFASSGNGTAQHLAGALFQSMAGARLHHIPYKSSGQVTADLISGQVSVGFPGVTNVQSHVGTGRLRALGVTTLKRWKKMPEVPTIDESGLKGYEADIWLGFLAPKGLPPEIVAVLYREVSKVLQAPDSAESLIAAGAEVNILAPEQFGSFIQADSQKWAKVIKAIGAQVN